jgi:hypothetical protein
MANASRNPADGRSAWVSLMLATVAAVSAVSVCLFAARASHLVHSAAWIGLFLPVITIDVLITVVGVPRALTDLRRAGLNGSAGWQNICALVLFAVSAAASCYALWLVTHWPQPPDL